MKYRYEYNGNPEFVTLHVTEKLIEEGFGYVSDMIEAKTQELAELHNLLKGAKGAVEVSIRPYEVTTKRGRAFDRDEVLDSLRDILRAWLSLSRGISEEWEQLKTLRSDITMIQCESCREEQRREIARSMRDFDTLEY